MVPEALRVAAVVVVALASISARAETPDEWVQLGTRIHGLFGRFISAGIRIGQDAKVRFKAEPRGLSTLYYQGEKAPCPSMVDGVMLATQATPGQGTVQVASEKAPAGLLAIILIRNRNRGEGLRYTVTDEWLSKMLAWNKLPHPERYNEAM